MKKKLVVLLAAVMLFAFSANAYAASFSDVSDQSVIVQDAIKKTVALGIIEGYEDGTFGPDKTITRAEFAKIAVTAAGAKDTATMLEGNNSSFKDVKAGAWYTGWINASESLGIFLGDTNGNFRPNDTITNQEAITVMLRLLGYNDNLTGTWPVNYVTKANQIGILDDVNIVANAAAKRSDVVVILGDLLDEYTVTYDKDTNEFVYKQTQISSSDFITLLDDSFDGQFVEVTKSSFEAIDQVRDAAAKTLNWNVDYDFYVEGTTDRNGNRIPAYLSTKSQVFIVDEQTAVSHNAGSLFDLEGHQGNVYYVKENDKYYARFIEVKSYVTTTTNDVSISGNKVTVQKTNYNAVSMNEMQASVYGLVGTATDPEQYYTNDNYVDGVIGTGDHAATVGTEADKPNIKDANNVTVKANWTWSVAETQGKNANYANSNILLYRNDDDQVYKIAVDRDFTEQAYIVKSVNTNNVRLVGTQNKTVSMNDADTLIYDGDKFIAPSDLKPGDAILEITSGDLYVKLDTITGELNSTDRTDKRFKIGGKNYVCTNIKWLDEDYEDSGVDTEDVLGNNVTILLNKDNSIAAALVDETTTGNTIYGIVTSGGSNSGDWVTGDLNSITIYNEEGYSVNYDIDDDFEGGSYLQARYLLGALVGYKLNSDGEIKDLKVIGASNDWDNYSSFTPAESLDISKAGETLYSRADYTTNNNSEVEIKNNAYINFANKSLALASNAIIFEVDQDGEAINATGNKVDVTLVSRSNMLSKGDFQPEDIYVGTYQGGAGYSKLQYLVYDTNTSGAIKVMAYTKASTSDLNYAIVDSWNFRSSEDPNSVTFKGDDRTYVLKTYTADLIKSYADRTNDNDHASLFGNNLSAAGAGRLVAYTQSGDNVTIKYMFGKENTLMNSQLSREVTGVTNGLISVQRWDKNNNVQGGLTVMRDYRKNLSGETLAGTGKFYIEVDSVYDVMTDTNTLVFVIDATTGTYSEGSVGDISRGDYVYVPVIDSEGYADVVIVDEYGSYKDYGKKTPKAIVDFN